jgi:uncharacterized membrane protein
MLAPIYACNAGCVCTVATMDTTRQKVKLAQTSEEENTGRSNRKQVYVNYSVKCMQIISVSYIISVFTFHFLFFIYNLFSSLSEGKGGLGYLHFAPLYT